VTYYELLGVSPTAAPEEVHRAYRLAIRRYHPDVNNAPNAAQVTMRLNEAWATLASGPARAAYDRALRHGQAEYHPQAWQPSPHPAQAAWQEYPGSHVPYQVSPGYRFASVFYGGLCFVALFAFIASTIQWLPLIVPICGALVLARVVSRVLR